MIFRLRTLLIVLAILPPLLAVGWFTYSAWREEREQRRAAEEWVRYNHTSPPWFIPADQ
jgi:hypothetical protein